MRNRFCSKILGLYPEGKNFVDKCSDSPIYAYDCNEQERTVFTSKIEDGSGKVFIVINEQKKEIVHICVDGGLLKKGEGGSRFDCMVFDDIKLLLIEFKLNVTSTNENTLHKRFSDGINQIKEYFLNLKKQFSDSGDDINNYFKNENIISIIGVKKETKIGYKWNTQRNSQREKFRKETGSKIDLYFEYKIS